MLRPRLLLQAHALESFWAQRIQAGDSGAARQISIAPVRSGHGIAAERSPGRPRLHLSRAHIEARPVHGALDLAVDQDGMGELDLRVGAAVCNGVELTIHVADQDFVTAGLHRPGSARAASSPTSSSIDPPRFASPYPARPSVLGSGTYCPRTWWKCRMRNLLIPEMQPLEACRVHALLNAGQVVGVLGQQLAAAHPGARAAGRRPRRGAPPPGRGISAFGSPQQVEEVEVHPVGIAGDAGDGGRARRCGRRC